MIPKLRRWLAGEEGRVAPAQPTTRILMVCTGNICRSPTAEGVLRAKLERAGLHGRVQVDSAGTQSYHTSEPPDARAVRAAAQRGYQLGTIRARPLRERDFHDFDWLLAMDQTHVDWLLRRAPPEAAGRVALLMPLARLHADVLEVPDPYYGGPQGFEHVLDLVEDASDGVIERLLAGRPLAEPQGGSAP